MSIPLQYRWRKTLGTDADDFVGIDGVLTIGRMMLQQWGSYEGQWYWDVGGLRISGRTDTHGYMAGTAREVAAHMEATYDRLLPLSDGVGLRVEDEVAHYVERGMALPIPVQWRKAHLLEGMPMAEADSLYRTDYVHPSPQPTHSRRSRRR